MCELSTANTSHTHTRSTVSCGVYQDSHTESRTQIDTGPDFHTAPVLCPSLVVSAAPLETDRTMLLPVLVPLWAVSPASLCYCLKMVVKVNLSGRQTVEIQTSVQGGVKNTNVSTVVEL